MSSREIAELTEKRHDNVKRYITQLANDEVISYPQIEDGIKSANGVTERLYLVGKRDSFVVVAGLSPEFTARLVDRWQELEAAQLQAPALPSYPEALRALASSLEQVATQQAVIEQQRPAVEFVERYVEASGNKGFREVCKLLQANETDFRIFLLDRKIMYYLGGKLAPTAAHLDAKRFEMVAGCYEQNHKNVAYTAAKFTPKGIHWIAGLWAVNKLTCEAE